MTKLQSRISKLLTPLKGRRGSGKGSAPKTLTVVCTNDQSTEDVLAQLQDVSQNKHVNCVVLREMIQRRDNIQLFSRIHDLLRESKNFSNVRAIHLLEPHVHSDQYRRWCFKKTNFLHRIRREAKERQIEVTIHGTLILDSNSTTISSNDSNDSNGDSQGTLSQNVSNWLTLLQQLPKDPDITSIWIYLKEEAVVNKGGNRRPSQLDLLQSPVQKVFQALVELFNADLRTWQFINCHVLYHPSDDQKIEAVKEDQTQSLLDVAELYNIPLQVQWQPANTNQENEDEDSAGYSNIKTRTTTAALQNRRHSGTKLKGLNVEDDNTSTTVGMDGSSGALTAGVVHPTR